MTRRLIEEVVVPAEYGRAVHVAEGHTFRVIAIEGPQVGDMAIFNPHRYKETFDPVASYKLNRLQGTGNARRIQYLYSRPPWLSLMLSVLEDTVGVHWCLSGARCNRRDAELRGSKGYFRNCQDNLAEAIAPFGMSSEDVPDVFNLFMSVEYPPEGDYKLLSSPAKKGDYIEFLAHMDCLVALSACPAALTVVNGGVNKPLKIEVWSGMPGS